MPLKAYLGLSLQLDNLASFYTACLRQALLVLKSGGIVPGQC